MIDPVPQHILGIPVVDLHKTRTLEVQRPKREAIEAAQSIVLKSSQFDVVISNVFSEPSPKAGPLM